MPHDTPLITTIVAALVLAFVFGAIANRLRMPPLVGYLIAGVAVGPHSPGFVADQTLAPQLAEIGVILLMFGVGLNFSLRDLLSVRWVAIPGALIRLAIATALGVGLATLLGWPLLGGIVFGLALAVSSTVVLLKAMQDRHLVDSDRGHIAIGWLVVEDLAMVLALVLIPAFATHIPNGAAVPAVAGAAQTDAFVALTEQVLHTHLGLWGVVGITLVKLLAFVGVMVVVGRRIIPFILHATAHTGSRELFRLAVLAIALGVAAGAAYLFGVSLALGAFFAGMILSESELSHRAAQETLPLRDAFGVLFFVSVGMLFDPSIIVREPLPVLATLAIILFGKTIVAFLLLVLFRRPAGTALTLSAGLAQIGEFSFILAALGVSLGVLPEEGRGLVLAGSIISIILNPLMFWLSERLKPRFEGRAASHRTIEPELGPIVPGEGVATAVAANASGIYSEEEAEPTRQRDHVILIGYGRVGSVVGGELRRAGTPLVLVEDAEGRVHAAREAGIEVIVGNAATRQTLDLANVAGARCVVIAIPNAFEAGQATEQCRKLNPTIRIIARAHSDEEVEYLRKLGADEVIMGEREIGLGMIDWLKGQSRDGAAEIPKLAAAENLLQQASARQPEQLAGISVAAAPIAPVEETPMLVEAELPTPSAWEPIEPIVPPVAAAALAEDEAVDAAPAVASTDWSEVVSPAAAEPAEAPPSAVTDEAAPIILAASPASEVEQASSDETWLSRPEAGVSGQALQSTSTARVVPPSDIVILPPETKAAATTSPPPREHRIELEGELEPAPRQHYWMEEADSEPARADVETAAHEAAPPPPLPDLPASETGGEMIGTDTDEPWMAALERHLVGSPPSFGDEEAAPVARPRPTPVVTPAAPTVDIASLWDLEPESSTVAASGPIEIPQSTPQPVETPTPPEDPQPAPQPIETPQPREDPPPVPQPVETPSDPWSVPPPAPQPAETPTRAESPSEAPPLPSPTAGQGQMGHDIERTLDEWDRKEPRFD